MLRAFTHKTEDTEFFVKKEKGKKRWNTFLRLAPNTSLNAMEVTWSISVADVKFPLKAISIYIHSNFH